MDSNNQTASIKPSLFATLRDRFVAFFDSSRTQIRLLEPDQATWNQLLGRMRYVPWMYSWWHKEFYRIYTSTSREASSDLSFIILRDNKPIGIWPNHLYLCDGVCHAGLFEDGVLPPLYPDDIPEALRKATGRSLQLALSVFLKSDCGMETWQSWERFSENLGLSEWYKELMASRGVAKVQHQMFVDLSRPWASLQSSMRKSYKSLVKSGSRHFSPEVNGASMSREVWEEFRLLHQEVAGRVTRRKETWDMQYEAILQEEAFVVCLRSDKGRMVGGGLFCLSHTEVYYAVGAYDRALFDKPLGHVVQYYAIQEMQRRQLKWYRLGYRPYPQEYPQASFKDLSIAFFKEGFSTHLMPEFLIDVPTAEELLIPATSVSDEVKD